MLLFGLLLIAAPEPVGIVLLEAGEVSAEESAAVVSEMGRALRKLGREPVLMEAGGVAPAVSLELRILGAVRYLRIAVERRGIGPGEPRVQIDLRRDPEVWPVELERLLLGLLGPGPTPALVVAPAAGSARPSSLTPWLFAGVGAVALAVGVGFGLSSASARVQVQEVELSAAEFDRYAGRTQDHAIIADVFFIVAAVSALGAAASWVAD